MEISTLFRSDDKPVEWQVDDAPVDYPFALATMKDKVSEIAANGGNERVWLLEHPALYTAGTSAKKDDLTEPDFLPVFDAGRGGQYTYHGPGQRVVYFMLDLRERGRDVRAFVRTMESLVIDTLAQFNIDGYQVDGRVGVWVKRADKGFGKEDKIAAIGVRVSRWVSFHGISINLNPDLGDYKGIVPCGINDQGVTSFEDLGQLVTMPELDMALRASFERHFGPTKTI